MKSVGQRRIKMDVGTRINLFVDSENEGTTVKHWELLAHYHTARHTRRFEFSIP
jgi:hypothetical protein